jgi:hypothetical protein
LDVQIKKGEMGWACGTYGEEAGHMQGFGGETWKKSHSKKLDICVIILNWIFKK